MWTYAINCVAYNTQKRMLEMRACAQKMRACAQKRCIFRAHARIVRVHACLFRAHTCNFCAFFGQIVPKRGASAGCRVCVSREAVCVYALFYQKRMRMRIIRLRRRTLVPAAHILFCQFSDSVAISATNNSMLIFACQ